MAVKRSQGGTQKTARSSAAKISSGKTTQSAAGTTKKQKEELKRLEEEKQLEKEQNRQLHRNVLCLGILVICILLMLGIFQKKGFLADVSSYTLFGMFGLLGYIFPVFFLVEVFFFLSNRGNRRAKRKLISGIFIFLVLCAIWQLILEGCQRDMGILEYFTSSKDSHSGGGLFGGIQVYLLCRFLGIAGAWVILLAELVLLLMYFTEKFLFSYLGKKGVGWMEALKEKFHEMKETRMYEEEEEEDEPPVEMGRRRNNPVHEEEKPAEGRKMPVHKPLPQPNRMPSFLENDVGMGAKVERKDFLQNPETGNVFLEESDSGQNVRPAEMPDRQEPQEYHAPEDIRVEAQGYGMSSDSFKEKRIEKEETGNFEKNVTELPEDKPGNQLRPSITITRGTEEKKPEGKKKEPAKEEPDTKEKSPLPFYEKELAMKFHGSLNGEKYKAENSGMDLPDSLELDIDKMIQEGRKKEKPLEKEYFETDVLDEAKIPEETGILQEAAAYEAEEGADIEKTPDSQEKSYEAADWHQTDISFDRDRVPKEALTKEPGDGASGNGTQEEPAYSYVQESGEDSGREEESIPVPSSYGAVYEDAKSAGEPEAATGHASPEGVRDRLPKVDIQPVASDIIERPQAVQPLEEKVSSGEKPKTVLEILEEVKMGQPGTAPVQKPKHIHQFPPIDLLNAPGSGQMGDSDEALQETAERLQMTLDSFKVKAVVTNASCGPQVTRFEVQPEPGVKVSKITGLADDIKLNLAAADIRIEAPIPGKAAVGIEVPNKAVAMVTLRELLDTEVFKKAASKVTFAVGKDISGQTVVTDIAKMPHLLIAGSTGSGKSVCINTLIMSILYKADPEDVKLIMVDPKVVELSIYNGIPHLLIPVVTDPNKALGALNWAVAEMEDRYAKFKDLAVRDLKGYNEKIKDVAGLGDERFQKLPQIVIILDELADLMMVTKGEVETPIVRLSQKARAAGIHLIIATQRPSVDVITGLIKANVPSRIAFLVSSQIDSRTILDTPGAEHLIGKGDMLFAPAGFLKPVRVQGAFVSDEEVNRVVGFLTRQYEGNVYDETLAEKINSTTAETKGEEPSKAEEDGKDEYFKEAARLIVRKKKASIGLLQRAFKIGYNRAARMMDQLCEAGIVGEEQGTKPRELLVDEVSVEELLERIS